MHKPPTTVLLEPERNGQINISELVERLQVSPDCRSPPSQ